MYLHKGLSKNYVSQNVGMKCTRFSALAETLFLVLSFDWVFGVQLDSPEKSVSANVEKCVDLLHSYIFWYLIFGLALSAPLFWEILPGHETTNKSIGFLFTNNGTTWQNLDLCLWIQLKYWPNSLVLTFRVEEVAKILKNFTKNVSKAKFISWNDLKYAINTS